MATQLLKFRVFPALKNAYASHSEMHLKQLRHFGFIMACFFAVVLGLGPMIFKHHPVRLWPMPIATFFLIAGLARPGSLKPIYQGWMVFGGVLGWINTRILLGLVFFLLLTPIALLRRLFGGDTLGLKFDKQALTYRTVLKASTGKDMARQF